jgi:hypothetical protein
LKCLSEHAKNTFMITNKKKPKDIIELSAFVVAEFTEEKQPQTPTENLPKEKNPHAVALGRLGGLKGGTARKNKLTKEQRIDIARKAAKLRWDKEK